MHSRSAEFDRAVDSAFAELKRVGDISQLPLPLQIAIVITSAQGIIDNGGFQYFFEADWSGQPPYSDFVDAYRAIGALEEAQAIKDAVSLFPFADPHLREKERDIYKVLEQFRDESDDDADNPFDVLSEKMWRDGNVWRCLEDYVMKHLDSFAI